LIVVFSTTIAVAATAVTVAVVNAAVIVTAVTVRIAVTIAVITAVVVTATDIKSVAATTVASATAIIATFSAVQLLVDCYLAPPAEIMILSACAESIILSVGGFEMSITLSVHHAESSCLVKLR
jgi:hypothetical protein